MSKQCLDVQQMQHLQEMGLKLKPSIVHYYKIINIDSGKWYLSVTTGDISEDSPTYQYIPAYTLQDILDLLPDEIKIGDERCWLCIDLAEQWIYYYSEFVSAIYHEKIFDFRNGKELIDAAYEMLCWCIENGHVETMKHDKS